MSQLTEAQRRAVEHTGNTLLKAGAGTGKTSTLVNRVLYWITERGHSIDRLLMVTFTEASAAEMRQRIRELLLKRFEEAQTDDEADHIGEQLARLEQAQISTLHSFCLRLVRENFHLLDIDPDVRVLDDQQTRPLQERLLDELMREHVAGEHDESAAVQRLIRTYAAGTRERVQGWIKQVHGFVRTLPDPEEWIEQALAAYDDPDPVQWRSWLLEEIRDWRDRWIQTLTPLRNENDYVEQALAGVTAIPTDDELSQIAEPMAAIRKPGRWAKGTPAGLKKRVEKCYDEAARFSGWLDLSDDRSGLAEDWGLIRGEMATLLALVREFDRRFTEAKREIGGIDFADQEQLTLRLLRDGSNGVEQQCRDWFLQVMIDEAQDINRAQDAILSAVSGENRFIVGDIKQCIYQFRLTDPRIFDGYARGWSAGGGQVIPLQDNFRSHEGVIRFVNRLFESIMVPQVGGMDYDESARLDYGGGEERTVISDGEAEGARVEIHFLASKSDEEGSTTDTSVELEARMVASRFHELEARKYRVLDRDTKQMRPVEWRDMAVLLRSPSTGAEAYVREFRRFGIPLQAKRAGFYSAIEVADLINLLRLLDNPRQDIPLLAVLRSPLVGWDVEELGWLRVGHGKESCWESLRRVADGDESTAIKTKSSAFREMFQQWRTLVRQSSLSHALEVILEQTHYEALLTVQPRAEERTGNVRRLLDLARQYDPYQRQGLHRFIKFIDSQEEADVDLEPAPPAGSDTVQLMSVHQSKGLEFPVVAVGGLGKQFNEQDFKTPLTVDEDMGLCPQVFPLGPEQRYPSLPLVLARQRGRRELRGEELRLLYVACTRARDRLILAGAMNCRMDDLLGQFENELDADAIAGAKGAFEWLLPWMGTRVGSVDGLKGNAECFSWEFWAANDARLTPGASVSQPDEDNVSDPFAGADLDAMADRIEFAYPFDGATLETAKTSVSDLRRRAAEIDDVAKPRFNVAASFDEPVKKPGKLSAAELGTLHHSFLQRIDPAKAGSPQELKTQAHGMVQDGELSEVEFGALDYAALAGFWASQVGRAFLNTESGRLERELPFTVRFGTADLQRLNVGEHAELGDEDFVVVQGVVDLALIEDERILIADYKTDHFPVGDLDAKLGMYVPQLRLYALALERIYQRPVESAWLYFLSHGHAVDALERQ